MASTLIKPHKLSSIREEVAIITARNELSTHWGTERWQHTHTHSHTHTHTLAQQQSFMSYKTQKMNRWMLHHKSDTHTLIKEVWRDSARILNGKRSNEESLGICALTHTQPTAKLRHKEKTWAPSVYIGSCLVGEHFAMHSGIGLQRGGKFPVNFPETFQKFPEDSKKKSFQNFWNVSEIYWKFFTLFCNPILG